MNDNHPYIKSYLDHVVENQGRFFERLQDMPESIDSIDMIEAYMHSSTRAQLDQGHAYYLTLDDEQLKRVFLEESGYRPKLGESLKGFMPNWIGRFYAYAQWFSNLSSVQLINRFPIEDLKVVYPGAHDLDLSVAVEKLLS